MNKILITLLLMLTSQMSYSSYFSSCDVTVEVSSSSKQSHNTYFIKGLITKATGSSPGGCQRYIGTEFNEFVSIKNSNLLFKDNIKNNNNEIMVNIYITEDRKSPLQKTIRIINQPQ